MTSPTLHTRGIGALAGCVLALGLPAALSAQDRLIGTGIIAAGATADVISFGGVGFQQPGVGGRDSIRLRSIEQFSVPVSLALPIGTAWTVDVQSAFSYARLTYDPKLGSAGSRTTSTLYGPTDVRVRATGRLFNDAITFTAGGNVPTGKTELTNSNLTVLRAIAAPALGLGTPPVGAGPSGTVGLVAAKQVLGWAVAIGGSYELRGTYQPIAAIAAGSPSVDFQPGNVVRGSLGLDRLIGGHRVSLTGAVDVFADDELRNPAAGSAAAPLATVTLGPIYTTDVQIQFAVPRVREFVLWGSNRFRTRYERDGREVAGTSGNYFDGGLRTSIPLSGSTDLLFTGDGRMHSGLAINQGLATSGVISGGGTLGLVHRAGTFTIQPYLRAQGGQLRPRITGTAPRTAFFGGTAGLVIATRF
ncbi:MAG: hypothetical protein C0516_04310 [Gemmatimonas sp.]|jgi:hypothetical protein|uniref:hypothetical protein n=1 Tax=Gemmatimonas sp. UBA7669 TaxID=1946568 RepID=UPI0025BC9EE8|nr:hypothetical protein [Gemmatimonas sp. UBA7669]MBA3917794.1 hypothetical protein [Gemmatimonas sp.]